MKKIAQKIVLSLIVFSAFEQNGVALDSGTQNLTNTIGATDYFKINCAGDSDHLNFSLFENSVSTPAVISPQILNAKLTKLKLTTTTSAIAASTNNDISLKGGNGVYQLTLDTVGTNLTLKNTQTYSVQYQCLNTTGKVTTGSSTVTGSLANGKTKSFNISCSKSKTTGDTSTLKIKITNKTVVAKTNTVVPIAESTVPPSGNLTAQVIKNQSALNTIGDPLNVIGGNGDYFVMIDSPVNKAQPYHFQYSCLNTKNVESKTSPFQLLQDQ